MKKFVLIALLSMTLLSVFAPLALAEVAPQVSASDAKLKYYGMAVLGCAIGIGVAAFGTGIGQGLGVGRAVEGIARNPGASGKITVTLIIGLAMIESLAIYALVVVLIVLFANPFKI